MIEVSRHPARTSVLQVVLSLNPGGTERVVVEITRRLRRDIDIAVCCLDDAGPWGEDLRRDGVEVFTLGRRPGFRPGLGVAVAKAAAACRATVVHCHQYTPFVYGAIAALHDRNLRLIFTEHGRLSDAPPSAKRRLANRFLRRIPDRVFAVSEDLRQHMLTEGFRASDVAVIRNGIPLAPAPTRANTERARLALGLPSEAFVVGSVGRLEPVKDFGTMIDGFLRFKASVPDARLVIVGDGPERRALQALASAAGARDAVLLTGYRADVTDLMCAFDVYANASIFEGISLTVLEAMSAGVPVMATRVGGNPEVVADGHSGVLVPPRNPAALATELHHLHASPDLRARLAESGRARVKALFATERMMAEYAAVYSELSGGAQCVVSPVSSRRMAS